MLVAIAEAKMLTALLPNKSAPITFSLFSKRFFVLMALKFPSSAFLRISESETLVIAVSDEEKKAETKSKRTIIIISIPFYFVDCYLKN